MKKIALLIAIFAVSKVVAQKTPCTSNPFTTSLIFRLVNGILTDSMEKRQEIARYKYQKTRTKNKDPSNKKQGKI